MTQTVLLGSTKIKDMPFRIIDGDRGFNYPKGHEFSDTGFCLFLSAKNVTKDGFEFSQKQFITKEKDELLRKGKLERDDVVLTTRGTVGNVAIYDGSILYDNVRINSGMIIIRCNKEKILPKYLYFVLKSGLFQDQVENFRSGSAQPQLPIRDMQNMKLHLPSLEEQKDVINQIGTIDEKIELNRRMNETLEQMGQALFRHYFITNPEADKWKKRELGEFFPIKTGKKDANFGTEDGEYPFFTCAQTISKAPDFSFDAHALLLAGNGGFNLKLYRGKFEAYQRTYVLVPNDERLVGVLYFLMSMKLPEITGGSRGSVIKFITKGMIENYKFALPDDAELLKLSEVFNQLTLNIEENVKQIQTLTALRDTLLPRLISGKVKV